MQELASELKRRWVDRVFTQSEGVWSCQRTKTCRRTLWGWRVRPNKLRHKISSVTHSFICTRDCSCTGPPPSLSWYITPKRTMSSMLRHLLILSLTMKRWIWVWRMRKLSEQTPLPSFQIFQLEASPPSALYRCIWGNESCGLCLTVNEYLHTLKCTDR